MKKVAVLLASYNGKKWIKRQIDSILCQKHVNITIFISDDLSTDGSKEFIQDEYKDNKVVLLNDAGKFGGAAKNFYRLISAVDFNEFDYISLADQDDIWCEDKLIHAISIMENGQINGYSSNVLAFWGDGRERLVKKSYPQKKFDYFFETGGPGCSCVLKRNSIQKFKKFLISNWDHANSIESHDWLIYAYFRSKGMRWKIDDKPLMYYRQHDNNQVGMNFGLKAYFSRFFQIKTKWYRNEVTNILILLNSDSVEKFHLERFFLIKNFWHLRRRFRDAIILLFMIIFNIF